VIIILMGAPGSGKGTQGRRLSDHFGVPYLASGDLLRRAIEQDNPLGQQAKQYVERGLYVPDSIMVPAVIQELATVAEERGTTGVVLDGFPRTREQAAALDVALTERGHRVQRVLFLTVPKEVLDLRLAGRWTCPNCMATYNARTRPPRQPGVCDRCGHGLVQRVDDRDELVDRRMGEYLQSTVPLVAYYRSQCRLVEVDGNRPADEVTSALIAAAGQGTPLTSSGVAHAAGQVAQLRESGGVGSV
jgi:adenylate kinase